VRWLSDNALDRLRAAADVPDLAGTRYRLVDKLGQGGMGGVYRVEDTALQRQVALKVINLADPDGELAARLLREARVIAQLEHPGIVPVHDVGTLPDRRVFYTMKLVQGKRLDQHIAQFGSLPDRLRAFQRVCEAVAFAHAHSVLHRDLKPENIMVGPFGEVLVMDWGLSKVLNGACETNEKPAKRPIPVSAGPPPTPLPVTAHGVVLGTPGYMAPEQARGEVAALDERADVFALGALLKFLLTAEESAGSGQTTAADSGVGAALPAPGAWPQRLPRALVAIAQKAMAENPANRYSGVNQLALDIAHYLDGLPVAAYPEGPLTRAWRWVCRNRVWIVLILAYVVVRALIFFWRGR
jgi:serine/threonine protein kinase